MSNISYLSIGAYYAANKHAVDSAIEEGVAKWLSSATDAAIYRAFFSCGMKPDGRMPEDSSQRLAA